MMKIVLRVLLAVFIFAGTLGMASYVDAATSRSYQYDTSGRLQSITLPGYKITFSYDKNGNLVKRSITATK